jgi:ubiquinone/menaquinone biosynthesis C-methylase UbiE
MDDPPARSEVAATYDTIAGHFSKTREYPWPEVENFLNGRCGDVGLDLGCGNGRHVAPLASQVRRVLALDVSGDLLGQARSRIDDDGVADAVALCQGDAGALPFRADVADVGVYVATLHHLPTRGGRVSSLDELARVLSPDGHAVVSVWSTEHDRFEDHDEGFDTTVDWTLPDGETVPRYYHVYAPDEFRTDLDTSALDLVEVFVSSGNCYAVVGGE